MGYTRLGEFLRVKRVENHEVMGDMAKFLNVSTAFLSAVENGKKNIPVEWREQIIKKYLLNDEEIKELDSVIDESKTQVKINLVGVEQNKRELAIQFQRSFDTLDDETLNKLIEILERR